jgi:hypothetical protein
MKPAFFWILPLVLLIVSCQQNPEQTAEAPQQTEEPAAIPAKPSPTTEPPPTDPRALLAGSWKTIDVDDGGSFAFVMQNIEAEKQPVLQQVFDEMVRQAESGVVRHFVEGGSYYTEIAGDTVDQGRWDLSPNGRELIITSDAAEGQAARIELVLLNESELRLRETMPIATTKGMQSFYLTTIAQRVP